ncbi:MAG: phenylalanine--tRNA ligase subunit alpha [Bacteroidota bacterium]
MHEQIEKLRAEIEAYPVNSPLDVAAFRSQFIAKKGAIAELFHALRCAPPAEKKALGALVNALKERALQRYKSLVEQWQTPSAARTPEKEDWTLPPPTDTLGALHPLTRVKNKIVEAFVQLGFHSVEGPEIEDDWHNFGALNFPPNHPARDVLDTFFVDPKHNKLLRTHTSSMQIRALGVQKPPIRIISAGRVYRREVVSARANYFFHQLDGCYIHRDVSFADLKQTLLYFVKRLFGTQCAMRLRPSYFPFTEPSAEVDMSCYPCGGRGCNLCKHTGWVEIMGAGMIDPAVLQHCHIDPEVYTGFAFGLGIERIAMLLYGIRDLRLFVENDIRFLKQFAIYS